MAETGYCVKEKQMREMKDVEQVTMKNGRPALKGKCTVCGAGMFKIVSTGAKDKSS
jgi:DNA polymerase II large subunit